MKILAPSGAGVFVQLESLQIPVKCAVFCLWLLRVSLYLLQIRI